MREAKKGRFQMIFGFIKAASAVISAGASIYGGIQQQKAADKQAKILREQAADERRIAEENRKDLDRQKSATLATQRARRAASGVSQTGTSLLVDDQTAQEYERGLLRIVQGGEISARRLTQQAKQTKKSGRSYFAGGFASAGTTLLGNIDFG